MAVLPIALQYFDGCPSWQHTAADLESLSAEFAIEVTLERIETHEEAVTRGFRGSPTVLVDGVDPFAQADAPVGLACRVYATPTGFRGSPTVGQLRGAIGGAADPAPRSQR